MIKTSGCRTSLPTNCNHFGGRVHTEKSSRETNAERKHKQRVAIATYVSVLHMRLCKHANKTTQAANCCTVKFSTLDQQSDGLVAFTWPVHIFPYADMPAHAPIPSPKKGNAQKLKTFCSRLD